MRLLRDRMFQQHRAAGGDGKQQVTTKILVGSICHYLPLTRDDMLHPAPPIDTGRMTLSCEPWIDDGYDECGRTQSCIKLTLAIKGGAARSVIIPVRMGKDNGGIQLREDKYYHQHVHGAKKTFYEETVVHITVNKLPIQGYESDERSHSSAVLIQHKTKASDFMEFYIRHKSHLREIKNPDQIAVIIRMISERQHMGKRWNFCSRGVS